MEEETRPEWSDTGQLVTAGAETELDQLGINDVVVSNVSGTAREVVVLDGGPGVVEGHDIVVRGCHRWLRAGFGCGYGLPPTRSRVR
jgi:hypothetical protein